MTTKKLTVIPSDDEIESIYNAIQYRAKVSLVDHRFIFATILQEVRPQLSNPHQTPSTNNPNPRPTAAPK